MGMYNTVTFRCPVCGANIEEQTKSGGCTLSNFRQEVVPIDEVSGLSAHIWCAECETKLDIFEKNTKTVHLLLIPSEG